VAQVCAAQVCAAQVCVAEVWNARPCEAVTPPRVPSIDPLFDYSEVLFVRQPSLPAQAIQHYSCRSKVAKNVHRIAASRSPVAAQCT
jgi:hypothetical protein